LASLVILAAVTFGALSYLSGFLSAPPETKAPQTADGFKSAAASAGYATDDITEIHRANYGEMVQRVIAVKHDSARAEFFETDSDENAARLFNEFANYVDQQSGGTGGERDSATVRKNRGRGAKKTAAGGGKYYIVSRIGPTLLWAYADDADKKNLVSLTEGLGY
jgi:hypothetical protein